MIEVARAEPDHADVVALVEQSHALMQSLYPSKRGHPADLASLKASNMQVFLAREDGVAVGCGALILDQDWAEMKRIFVAPAARGRGIATTVIDRLEREAMHAGRDWMRLEVGILQTEGFALYRKLGYAECGPFGSYVAHPLSRFVEKRLIAAADAKPRES